MEAVHQPLMASSIAAWSLCFPLSNLLEKSLSSSPLFELLVCTTFEFCAIEIEFTNKLQMRSGKINLCAFILSKNIFLSKTSTATIELLLRRTLIRLVILFSIFHSLLLVTNIHSFNQINGCLTGKFLITSSTVGS